MKNPSRVSGCHWAVVGVLLLSLWLGWAGPGGARLQAAEPQGLSVDLGNGVSMEFALIRAGAFTMGSNTGYGSEKPAREVKITKDFYIGKYEVTQEHWQAVMGRNPSNHQGAKYPVEMVSWEDCQEFVAKLNAKVGGAAFRLPTEAEWEYACRAGSTTAYSFGDASDSLADYAWYGGNSDITRPVGEKKPNPWGLYDMYGNVSEWCQDWKADYTKPKDPARCPHCGGEWCQLTRTDYKTTPVNDPQGPEHGEFRTNRGGAWISDAYTCRSANRGNFRPGTRSVEIGLRLVRVAP